jgi:mannose-6-phosphate isomerase-like protein (cupin superfamily)
VSGVFSVSTLINQIRDNHRHHEFVRVPAMSAGIYVLPAGHTDRQIPHKEDELYYVVRGQAKMMIGTEKHAVSAGDAIFVDAGVEHRFLDIEQELVLLVMFAPEESD